MTYVWTGFSDWFVRSQASTALGRSVVLPVAYGVEAADSIITLCRLLPVDRGLITTQAVRSRVFFSLSKRCPVPGSTEWLSPTTTMHHGFGAMLWFCCRTGRTSPGHLPQFAFIVPIAMFLCAFASGHGGDAQHAVLLWLLAICSCTRLCIHFRCNADGTGTTAVAGGHGITMPRSLADALAIRCAGIDGRRVIGSSIGTSHTICPAGGGGRANHPEAI